MRPRGRIKQRARSRAAESEVHMTGRSLRPTNGARCHRARIGDRSRRMVRPRRTRRRRGPLHGSPMASRTSRACGTAAARPIRRSNSQPRLRDERTFHRRSSKPSCRREPSAGLGRPNGRAPPPARASTRATSRMHRIGSIRTGVRPVVGDAPALVVEPANGRIPDWTP